jgi:micrococcal nuclease
MSVRRTVRRVVDGDTFEVGRRIGHSRFVRLSGVNAPERYQLGGRRATNTLRGMIGGKTVTIRNEATDKYGRVVGTVFSNRRNVNKRLKSRI